MKRNVALATAAVVYSSSRLVTKAQEAINVEHFHSDDPLHILHTTHWLAATVLQTFSVTIPLSFVWLSIFFLFLFLAYIVPNLFALVLRRCVTRSNYILLTIYVARIAIIIYGLFLAFGAVGIDLAGILVGFGLLGIALSDGLRAVIANGIAGIVLQMGPEVAVGRTVELTTMGPIRGRIVRMDLRQIQIKPDDGGGMIYIPNQIFADYPHRVFDFTPTSATPTGEGEKMNATSQPARDLILDRRRVTGKDSELDF